MAEYEELRITLTLVDNVSAGLAKLNDQLKNASTSSAQALERVGKETEAAQKKIAPAKDLFEQLGVQLGGRIPVQLAAVAGVIGMVGLAAAEQVRRLREYASEMMKWGVLATQTGFGAGELKSLSEQLQQSGINSDGATRILQGLSGAIADFTKVNSTLRQNMLRGLGPEERPAMEMLIGDLARVINNPAEFANLMKQAGDNIYENALKKWGPARAADARRRFLAMANLQDLAQMQGRLRPATEDEIKRGAERVRNAKEYYALVERISQAWEHIKDVFLSIAIDPNSPFVRATRFFADNMERAARAVEALEHFFKSEKTPEAKAAEQRILEQLRKYHRKPGASDTPLHFMGGGANDFDESLTANTEELKRLNDYLMAASAFSTGNIPASPSATASGGGGDGPAGGSSGSAGGGRKMLILKGIRGLLDQESASEYARLRGYEPMVLPTSGEGTGTQTRDALAAFRKDPSIAGIYGFSGGGYNTRRILGQLTAEERKRIEDVTVIGSPLAPEKDFAGPWRTTYRTDPPQSEGGHMGGPAALLREERARILAEQQKVPAGALPAGSGIGGGWMGTVPQYGPGGAGGGAGASKINLLEPRTRVGPRAEPLEEQLGIDDVPNTPPLDLSEQLGIGRIPDVPEEKPTRPGYGAGGGGLFGGMGAILKETRGGTETYGRHERLKDAEWDMERRMKEGTRFDDDFYEGISPEGRDIKKYRREEKQTPINLLEGGGRGRVLDRSAIDKPLGDETGGGLSASGKLSVTVDAPRDVEVKASGTGLFGTTETTRTMPMEE